MQRGTPAGGIDGLLVLAFSSCCGFTSSRCFPSGRVPVLTSVQRVVYNAALL
jgi:hypothetical protein